MNTQHVVTGLRSPSRFAAALIAVLLSGCAAVGPDYVRPKTALTGAWSSRSEGGTAADTLGPHGLAEWWTAFNDPQLTGLIDRAVQGNLDLKSAKARIREARARRGIAMADLFPAIGASGSATVNRSSTAKGNGQTSDVYIGGFDAQWELDLFGGVRRSIEASTAELQSNEEDLRDVLVSLIAETALNFIEVRTYQHRLAAAEASLESQTETFRLTQWRYQAGLGDELAVQQARYSLENTRSQIPTLLEGLEAAKNRIALLLGRQPGSLHAELEARAPILVTPVGVAVGIPADILRRRPDIRRAERRLAAQTAKIGVATAELYPRFTLSGSIGLEALSPGNLLSSENASSGGTAGFSWSIFRGGSIRRNIAVQTALQEQCLIAYETAVLGALEEVENALVAFAKEQERRRALSEATEAARMALELARHQYQSGLSDFGSILEAQRSLLSFEDQQAGSDGTVASNLIRLYKALGGGWTSLAPDGESTDNLETIDGNRR